MPEKDPTVRARELGATLRQALNQSGLNGKEAARLLGWSETRLSRFIAGKTVMRERDVAAFLGVCRAEVTERDRLLDLYANANSPGWLQRYGTRLPKQVRTLVGLENQATAISSFEIALVPGLLQTRDYARALIAGHTRLPEHRVEQRVIARAQRQELFERFPRPQFDFFIDEFVLHRMVGGPAVMSEQMHHLLRMSVRKYLSIRVIPASIAVHAGIASSFTLLDSAEGSAIYLDSETSCLFLDEAEEIAAYRAILLALAGDALDEEQSRGLLSNLAEALSPPREDDDDPHHGDLADQ